VTATTLRRRRLAARYALVVVSLALVGTGYAAITASSSPAAASAPSPGQQAQIIHGEDLFNANCATCHGFDAQGKAGVAPSLVGVGSAAVDFQVSTGRMPLKEPDAEAPRKPPAAPFLTPDGRPNERNIRAVAAYVESLGGGPEIPSAAQDNPNGADIGLGQQLFIANCAQCHNFSGAGGALTYGKYAPPLTKSTPAQIYEAMLTGPEAMPVFSDGVITPAQKRDVIDYVLKERSVPNPGGFSLGRVGPVTEGLVVFLGLLFVLVMSVLWITAKQGKERPGITSAVGETGKGT